MPPPRPAGENEIYTMICEICKKNQAKIHVTQIKENKKISIHLCQECAHEKGVAGPAINTHFSVADLLTGLLKGYEEQAEEQDLQRTCLECGLTYNSFKESGRFGCGECYNTFQQEIEPLLQKIQKQTRHVGKIPRRCGEEILLERNIADLRKRLQDAVNNENFEEAARLRDKIRDMEKGDCPH
jgi:protein arginine kinase activator